MTTPASKAAQPEPLADAAAELPAVERQREVGLLLQSLVALAQQPVGEAQAARVVDAVAPWSILPMA